MRARLVVIGLVVAVGSIGAGVVAAADAAGRAALPAAACSLPGAIPCTVDSECVAYDAVCDSQAMICVCAVADLGTDLGAAADLATTDLSPVGDGGGGSSSAGPFTGGGMVGPPKSAGCSFVPGSQ